MQHTTLAAALLAALSANALANPQALLPPAEFTLDEIVVTATRIPMADVLAPYASEVHTRKQIKQSGSATLFDYLAQHSSVQVLPSYGNKYTPKIDMRGYGIEDGYQNIAFTVDGRRLNNIDMAGPLLGAIPLADIERIEITKGSGSVLFGDGATAGSIQIITRAHRGVSLQASAGNFGMRAGTATAGVKKDRFSLSASAEYSHTDGYSAPDVVDHKDASSLRNWRGAVEVNPVDRLKLGLDLESARIVTRYVGPLTQAAFNANSRQNGGNEYTPQAFDSDTWRLHAGLELTQNWGLTARHSVENKRSEYLNSGGGVSDYDYVADDLAAQYRDGVIDFTAGAQRFDGVRIGATNHTRKENMGWYAQGQYRLGATTLSAGARKETVDYTYRPNAGAVLAAGHRLQAWDIGANHLINPSLSLFANYNRAFQAPDIDRFFNWNGTFNDFIAPAKSRTLNLGLNHVTAANRFKLTLFRADLDNEIYFFNTVGYSNDKNTNLDKTHKYGLELQDAWRVSDAVSLKFNYAWTRARIDREVDGGGAFNGKDLPGVPEHGVSLGLAYAVTPSATLNVAHVWRSATWAADDFDNNNAQKQAAYQSTDVALRYRRGALEWFAAVDNLFERKNGLWVADNAIYPVSFTRNWRLGLKADF